MGLTLGFLFIGISLQVLNASIDFGSTIADASVIAKQLFAISVLLLLFLPFCSVACKETDQLRDEMALLHV